MVDPEILFREYLYVSSSSLGLVEHFRRLAEHLRDRLQQTPGSLVVDIGSNDGSLLKCFQSLGFQVLGVDPAREVARAATEAGVETWPHFFTADVAREIRRKIGPAALITAANVFAHADDLADIADGVRELLATDGPGGVFVFEVSYVVDVLEKFLLDTIYHEHLCYHSVRPLCDFLKRHGLEMIDAERIPSKGGSLRCYVQRAGGARPIQPSVERLISLEEEKKIHSPETWRSFADRIETCRTRLGDLLAQWDSDRLAGYGASPGATTLIYQLGLDGKLACLLDDNPRKQGLYSPGLYLPVLPSEAIYRRRPDAIVLLAWMYAEPILKNHERFRREGGRFLLPLPEPRLC